MKKLTKDQRFTAYCIMLAEIDNHFKKAPIFKRGLCFLVWDLFRIENSGYNTRQKTTRFSGYDEVDTVLNHFPELKNKEPLGGWPSCYDDDGILFRKNALKQCIAETA